MSSIKSFVLCFCVAVALFGVFQATANAGLIASWGLDESPVAYPVNATVEDPNHGTGTGTVCTDSSGNGYNLMYGYTGSGVGFTSVTLGSDASVPAPLRATRPSQTTGTGLPFPG